MDKEFLACGLGNAIVDANVTVSFFELESFGLKRDESCLIDLEKKNKLEKFMKTKAPIISSGGSIANSIYTLSSLYGNSAFIGALGNDDLGKTFYDEFTKNNIKVAKDIFKDNVNTGVCFVLVMPNAERSMAVFLGDCASIDLQEDDKELIKKSQYLLLEMYPVSNDEAYNSMNEAVKVAKENDTKIVVSFSDKWVIDACKDRVSEFAQSADIIFCNNIEAETFSGSNSMLQMMSYYKSKNDDKDYIITLGKNGAVAIKNGEAIFCDAYPATPKDLTGAGDMFLASFIYAQSLGLNKHESLEKSCYMSSKVICKVGARLEGNLKDIWNQI